MMKRIGRGCFELAHRIMPKRNHAVIWGWPDHEDHGIALESALQKSAVRRVVILMTDPASPPPCGSGPKTVRARKNSLSGLWWFLTARYVFFTHPCFTRKFPKSVVSVNVWHGMPVKKIGWLLPGDAGIACSHTPVTSPFWGDIMQRAMTPGGVLPDIGLPRNDRLFVDRAAVMEKLGLPIETRLLAWLPTYRKSVRGLPREDGRAAGNVFEMPDIDPVELNDWLAARDAVLVVKPHPMAAGAREMSSHLWIVDDAWMAQHHLTLYGLLGASDALISDISSAVIDYLLLDRPVIHAFADLDAYRESRGFTVDPIDDFFAGPVAVNARELHEAMAAVLNGGDPDTTRRRKLLELSHSNRDGLATRRLLDLIGI